MPPIKSMSVIADKWKRRAGAAGSDYSSGVSAPRRPWQSSTVAANDNWKQGITQAVSADRFAKGVGASSDSEWQTAAKTKGVPNYTTGVNASQAKYERKFAPYANVIASTTLSPRGPKGSSQNLVRVAEIANALHAAKVGA